MLDKDVQIGMKVVPHRKTACLEGLGDSVVWNNALDNGMNFLYIAGYDDGFNCWILNDSSVESGDYFNASDFEPYEEEYRTIYKNITIEEFLEKTDISKPLISIIADKLRYSKEKVSSVKIQYDEEIEIQSGVFKGVKGVIDDICGHEVKIKIDDNYNNIIYVSVNDLLVEKTTKVKYVLE